MWFNLLNPKHYFCLALHHPCCFHLLCISLLQKKIQYALIFPNTRFLFNPNTKLFAFTQHQWLVGGCSKKKKYICIYFPGQQGINAGLKWKKSHANFCVMDCNLLQWSFGENKYLNYDNEDTIVWDLCVWNFFVGRQIKSSEVKANPPHQAVSNTGQTGTHNGNH